MKFGTVEIRLNTKWVNYNCGVRMAGMLRKEMSKDGGTTWGDLDYDTHINTTHAIDATKKEIIQEFIANIGNKEFTPELWSGGTNPVFPFDKGKYPPTVLMVADDLAKMKIAPLTGWAGLVRELQDNHGTYGVIVNKGPLFNNATYGVSPHISRVWLLTIPVFKDKLSAHPSWSADQLRQWGYTESNVGVSEWKELKEFIAKAA